MRLGSVVTDLLVPPRCIACGQRGIQPWCASCDDAARRLDPATRCRRCAGPSVVGHGCWPTVSPVDATVAAFEYTGVVSDAVVAGKLAGAHAVLAPLGREIGLAVAAAEIAAQVVTWVPTEPRRRRARGVDHARRLALAAAHVLRLPPATLLIARSGSPDRGHLRSQRRPTVDVASFVPVRRVPGRRVLLIDDVLTTGLTAATAAVALRAAGAASVALAVVGRAGDHPLLVEPAASSRIV